MTIKEWLTPELFDINVFLVGLLLSFSLISIVSNFLEDFHIPPKVQTINYLAIVLMSVFYGVLILLYLAGLISNEPTLYPNRFDFLLMGNKKALGCIIGGVVVAGPVGYILGEKTKARWTLAVLALICDGLIGLGAILWIISQE